MTNLQPLTEAEREIMELLWEQGELSATEIREQLEKTVARQTVQTVMARLVEKSWATYRHIGRTHLYRAAIQKEESLGQRVRELIDSSFGGSADELLLNLIQQRGLSKEEAKRIRKHLDDVEKRRRRSK